MARVVSDTALGFDELGDSTGRPQSVVEAQSLRPALQSSLDPAPVCCGEPRWTPNLLRFTKRTTSSFLELSCPATDRLSMDADLSGDFGLAQAFAQ